jgi:single-strand DNA-binding protein
MSGVNKIFLIGNVGKTPEIRELQEGGSVANFSLAVNESWKDKQGNKQEKVEWFNIVVYNKGLIKLVENYIKKGSKLSIEGSVHTRKYQDSAGKDCYITEIILRPFNGQIVLLDNKENNIKSTPPIFDAP